MSENLDLWARLSKTDKKFCKDFKRYGGFSGTSIDPMWRIMRMTEEFGPCGQGWSINEPNFQTVPTPEGKILVFCWLTVTIGDGGTVAGVGGEVLYDIYNNGKTVSKDEAFKMAFTDALGNALKHLGMAADVYMGNFDADKYMAEGGHDGSSATNGRSDFRNGQARKNGYQSRYVKPQDDDPPHDPETGEIQESDHFADLDDGGPLPAPKFKGAKEMLRAIETAPSLTELAVMDQAYQAEADNMKPATKERLFEAIQDRMKELQEEAA